MECQYLGGGERGGGNQNNNNNNHYRQLPQDRLQQNPHVQCPRCDSMSTKFCYYNNYSLSQPRYYCKACKRYWTHGGTIRNVPVGGGSRKGKRARVSSSSSSSRSVQEVVQLQSQTLPSLTPLMNPSPYGGLFPSLATVHSLNQSQLSNNSALLTGFDLGLQNQFVNQIPHPSNSRFYNQIGTAEQGLINVPSNVGNAHANVNANAVSALPDHWAQSFANNNVVANNERDSDGSFWNAFSNTAPINGSSDQNNFRAGSSSFIPNHWPDFSGYGPPPQ